MNKTVFTRILVFLLGVLLCAGVGLAQQSTPASPLADIFSSNENELLEADQAFKLSVSVRDANTLVAQFYPAPGYYLYRQRISFSIEGATDTRIAGVDLPPGEAKNDPLFGETRVFHQPFTALVSLKREATASNLIKLKATYQGCSEKGICYPPINKTFNLTLAGAGPSVGSPEPSAPAGTFQNIDEMLATSGLWWVVGGFFLAGLGLAFTPCVLPMIPILSGIIAGQGKTITRRRGFVLSFSYVLGMALTYATAGVVAGLTGSLLAAALQNGWVLGGFAMVFVLLALSMFGLYELRMPALIQGRAHSLSNRLSGGKLAAVFGMGALSALIVSPCVAAPLAGALLYISQSRDVLLGGTALFALALGMGVPLLAVGISAGALLPRAGAWMDAIKRVFGVLLLAVAIWIVSPVIPMVWQMLAWAALLIMSAIFLRALDPLPPAAGGFLRLAKGVGIIALVAGVAILVGALAGSRDLLQPLAVMRGGASAEKVELEFERVGTLAQLKQRLGEVDGPVMLDFYADWCVSCKEMEQFTFRDSRVAQRLRGMVLLQVDVTRNTAEDQVLLKHFGLFGPPGIIFFNHDGQEMRGLRVIGYQPADIFLRTVDRVLDVPAASKPTLTYWPQARIGQFV